MLQYAHNHRYMTYFLKTFLYTLPLYHSIIHMICPIGEVTKVFNISEIKAYIKVSGSLPPIFQPPTALLAPPAKYDLYILFTAVLECATYSKVKVTGLK